MEYVLAPFHVMVAYMCSAVNQLRPLGLRTPAFEASKVHRLVVINACWLPYPTASFSAWIIEGLCHVVNSS